MIGGEKVTFKIRSEMHTVVDLNGNDHFLDEVEPARYWNINMENMITTRGSEGQTENFVEKFELVEYMKVILDDGMEHYVRA